MQPASTRKAGTASKTLGWTYDIQPAELFDGCVDERDDVRLDGGVPSDSGCPSALSLDGFHHGVELIVLPRQVVNHDVDSIVCESESNGFADALRRPGDDGNARSSAGKILVNHSGKGSCC